MKSVTQSEPALTIQSVTKIYGAVKALDHVSLALPKGKTHVLLGSSGSGKSTILRAILGLVELSKGEILLEGVSISNMTAQARAGQIGYVPQDAGLFPHLTARENVTVVARSLGWSARKSEERLRELNAIVQLGDVLLDRYPSELSGGQRQRVALLRALFLDPALILMDEPFGALDPLVRAEIQAEVKTLFARLQKTVVFVTHDVGEAHFLADHLILMHEGRVVQQGVLSEFMNQPAEPFVTRFLQAQRVFQASRGQV